MGKLKLTLLSVTAILALSFVATPVFAGTTDDLKAANEKFTTATDEFYSDVLAAANNSDVKAMSKAVDEFKTIADSTKTEFARINKEAKSDGWRAISDKMTKAVNDMSLAAQELQTAIAARDASTIDAAGEKFDAAAANYQDAIDEANTYIANNPMDSGDTQWMLWFGLLAVSVVCLVGAIAIAMLTRKQHGTTTDKNDKATSLKDVRRNIVIGAGIFVIGAAIPAVQYWWGMTHTSADGTFSYYILWYPLAIGAFLFIASAFQYITVYSKVKKAGGLAHTDNATEMAKVDAAIKVPKIGSKSTKKKS